MLQKEIRSTVEFPMKPNTPVEIRFELLDAPNGQLGQKTAKTENCR